MKELLSGNEAIARGAYECGVTVATGYPGTPSTEILENIAKYEGVYAEWSPNEKVALDVAAGASFGGARVLVAMKHVGINVAADPLFTLSYTGVKGGLVIITADDPELHSSQNEQDNRNYAKFAKIPMLEPSDSQEAKEFVKIAFEISEKYDTPVFLRTTTRISHSKSIVELHEPKRSPIPLELVKNPAKLVMLPANARRRHPIVEERLGQLKAFADEFSENKVEINNANFGIITSGVSYQYAKEVFPDYSYLKLGLIYPLPEKLIKEFASKVERLYVVEELDLYIEEQIKAMGIKIAGKDIFPICGEFNPSIVENAISPSSKQHIKEDVSLKLPPRPPNMCPGCGYRGIFYVFNKLKLFVAGDIGCYTLGFLPPLSAIDTCVSMGGSIGHAMGLDKALGDEAIGKVIAVIGDSTFLHSGITSLLDIVYNRGSSTVVILDNQTTAMTGRQEHPGTGLTLKGETAKKVDLIELCKGLGVEHVRTVDPFDLTSVEETVKEEILRKEPSVIISQAPCVLLKSQRIKPSKPFMVFNEKCNGCKACIKLGCPAIEWKNIKDVSNTDKLTSDNKKRKGIAIIDSMLCNGCGLCQQLCKFEAIGEINA
ncbi:MAG: indolepyruvate ferredoxin oxidoreductase subunit alpha [Deltaproteobacteria bacterium CG_4_10_14_0_8_um_filter_43_12]|nr:MAG: indolepyruvate ferredoxin oxidoreductase subunit alpha [Deltaproteobacteria bacterium CG_4_10_14_0_8_um_filter_43_12]